MSGWSDPQKGGRAVGAALYPTLSSLPPTNQGSPISVGGVVYGWSDALGRYVAQSPITQFPLSKFSRKVANLRSGASAANIKLCFDGDSHTAGVGCGSGGGSYNLNNAASYTPSAIIGRLLAAQGFNVYADSWFGAKGTGIPLSDYDPRFAFTGTWTARQIVGASLGSGVYGSANIGDTMVFTPNGAWDTCDVYTVRDTSLVGAISIAASGATTQNVSFGGTNGWIKTTLTKATPSTGAITITVTTGMDIYAGVNGIVCKDSTKPGLEVLNTSAGGATWAMNNKTTRTYSHGSARTTLAPDVLFVDMLHNDLKANTPLATWLASWQTFVNAHKATADIVVYVGFPGSDARFVSIMPAWIDALRAQLAADGINLFDWRNLYGQTYAEANAAGLTNDVDHGNKPASALRAAKMAQDLLSALGTTW